MDATDELPAGSRRPGPRLALSGQVVAITGGASGIGRATAREVIAHGGRVALLDVNEDQLADAVSDLPGQQFSHPVDVTSQASIDVAFTALQDVHRQIHGLVNCAGIVRGGGIDVVDPADFAACLDVNVTGTYLISRAALPMLRRTGGSIVNVASVAGLVGIAAAAAYCASKGAVIALTRAMSADHAPEGVRVNAVCPGTIDTPLIEPMIRERGNGDLDRGMALTTAKYPVGRLGTPGEVAAAIRFLLSADAGFMTGTSMVVDGGMTSI